MRLQKARYCLPSLFCDSAICPFHTSNGGVYDARNPRADAFLNCFLLLPRRWVFQFAGFIVMCLRALLSF